MPTITTITTITTTYCFSNTSITGTTKCSTTIRTVTLTDTIDNNTSTDHTNTIRCAATLITPQPRGIRYVIGYPTACEERYTSTAATFPKQNTTESAVYKFAR